MLTKTAYGSRVVEVVFNEVELFALFAACELLVRHSFVNISHTYLDEVLGEPIESRTYLCEVSQLGGTA